VHRPLLTPGECLRVPRSVKTMGWMHAMILGNLVQRFIEVCFGMNPFFPQKPRHFYGAV